MNGGVNRCGCTRFLSILNICIIDFAKYFRKRSQHSLCTISSPLVTVVGSVNDIMNSQEDTFDSLGTEVGALETEVGDLRVCVATLSPEGLKVLASKQQELLDKRQELLELLDKKQEILDKLLDKQSKQLDKQSKQLDKQSKQLSVSQGKYFAGTKRVWKSGNHTLRREPLGDFSAENWRKLVRGTVDFNCLAMSKVKKRRKLYQSTKEHAEDSQLESISIKSVNP